MVYQGWVKLIMMSKNISTIGYCTTVDIVANGHSTLEEFAIDLLFDLFNLFGLGPIILCDNLNPPNHFTGSRDLNIILYNLSYAIMPLLF